MSIITNSARLQLEIGFTMLPEDLEIYLAEEGLTNTADYDPTSNLNKRKIYSASLAVLNSIANNPQTMKSYKEDDMTISDISDSIQNRIDQLERKLRMLPITDTDTNTSTFMLFNS